MNDHPMDSSRIFPRPPLAETPPHTPRIIPTLSDADIAADLKRRMIEAFQPILALCDEAEAKGFVLAYGSGKGPLGKQVITQLVVAKHF